MPENVDFGRSPNVTGNGIGSLGIMAISPSKCEKWRYQNQEMGMSPNGDSPCLKCWDSQWKADIRRFLKMVIQYLQIKVMDDHFSIETTKVWGILHFKKHPYS